MAESSGISPDGGIFNAPVNVTLWANDNHGRGQKIYYSLDGSLPEKTADGYSGFLDRSPVKITLDYSAQVAFIAVDESGKATEPVSADFIVDMQAPETVINPSAGFYGAAQSIVLSAADDQDAAPTIYYTLDGSDPALDDPLTLSGASPIENVMITANGVLKYFAVDQAGNAEAIQSAEFVIDPNAPNSIADPPGRTFNDTLAVTLTAHDNQTTHPVIYYTLDGSDPVTPAAADDDTTADDDIAGGTLSGVGAVNLELDSTTTVKFFAVDEAGNQEEVRSETYTLDQNPPTSSVTPDPGVFGGPLTATLEAEDAEDGMAPTIYYSTDGIAPYPGAPNTVAGHSPITNIPINQTTTLMFFAEDFAGNREEAQTAEFVVDIIGPAAAADPAGEIYDETQSVTITATDVWPENITIYYTIDGSTPEPGEGTTQEGPNPQVVEIGATTVLKFFARDEVGKDSPLYVENYCIDAGAPVTVTTPDPGSFPAKVYLTFTATDDCSGHPDIYFTLDGSEPEVGGPVTYHGVSPVFHVPIVHDADIKFFAVDQLGHQEATQSVTYIIDTVAPVVTAYPGSISRNAPFTVTLTATDEHPGTPIIYYTTDGSNPAHFSPSGPSPVEIEISADTVLKYMAEDQVENRAPIKTEYYFIDTTAPTVSANPPGGDYPYDQLVTLTASDDHTPHPVIFYTLDGSMPVPGSPTTLMGFSPVQNIFLTEDTTINFVALDEAENNSGLVSQHYNIH